MGLFNQRRPRRFHHEYIFAGKRKDRLRAMEERPGKDYDMAERPVPDGKLARGVFLNATKYASRRSERRASGGRYLTTAFAVISVLLLVLIWRLLLCLW